MIGVTLKGRLGNQLFQYALAIALAKKYRTFYIIDNDAKHDQVKAYFKTNLLLNTRFTRNWYKQLIQPKFPVIHQTGNEQVANILPLIGNNRHYKGFFQSEQYFLNIRGEIRQVFRIKGLWQNEFERKYGGLLQERLLVIHYRLGDYLTWNPQSFGGGDMSLPEAYYKAALGQVKNMEDYTVVVVTDDMQNAANKLDFLPRKQIISDSEMMDFQLLMHADKLIISNSSFAWWAAYLNVKSADVFAPAFWLGFKMGAEMPYGIMPSKFTGVPFPYEKVQVVTNESLQVIS
jgi:hypothetical protein